MKLTLKGIAKECGVSPATVSRVLRNDGSFRVSSEIREKVLETVRKTGYQPDFAARSLRSSKSRMVCICGLKSMPHPLGVYSSMIDGAVSELQAHGYEAVLDFSSKSVNESAYGMKFDGVISLDSDPSEGVLAYIKRNDIPAVILSGKSEKAFDSVSADDPAAVEAAMDYLYSRGHRKIAYAGTMFDHQQDHICVDERYSCFNKYLESKNMDRLDLSRKTLYDAVEFLHGAVVREKASAVLAFDHFSGLEVYRASILLGLKIPDDFSLLSFNDVYPVARLVPAFTVMAVPAGEMGKLAAKRLVSRMTGEVSGGAEEFRLAETLIVRDSVKSI